jgi:cation:H+ antiporter
LLAAAALGLLLTTQGLLPSVGHVSWGSLVILTLYTLAMRAMYLAEQRHPASSAGAPPAMSLKAALTGYALASMVIVGSGIWLPLIGVDLARLMGWSNSFVGTLFVAFATSVPELATTFGAVRIGAIDMAIANLLGSNLFDVLILAIDDLAYRPGNLYAQVSPMHAVSALSACLMTGAVVVALAYRPVSRVLHIGSWASIALLALYLLNAVLQYGHGQ